MTAENLRVLFQAQNSENRDETMDVAVALGTGDIWVFPKGSVGPGAVTPEASAVTGPSGNYGHFKGGRYRALLCGRNFEQPEQVVVVYVSLIYGTIWARPLPMWAEEVLWPDGQRRPRFVPEG